MKFKALFTAIIALAFAQGASAGLVTFDFTGGGPNSNSITFSSGGVDLVANGMFFDASANSLDSQRISWNNNGLGIRGNGSGKINVPGQPFDAELIEFVLPERARWVSVGLWNLGRNEIAAVGDFDGVLNDVFGVGRVNPQMVDVSNFGNLAALHVLAQNGFDNGNFRVSSITIEVPEPAMLVLFGAGLIGLGVYRRRKR